MSNKLKKMLGLRKPVMTGLGEADDAIRSREFFTRHHPDFAGYEIGEYTYGHPNVMYDEEGGPTLKIGKFCSLAHEATILLGGEHQVARASSYPFELLFKGAKGLGGPRRAGKGDVVIGHDVWVCAGVLIVSGVTIGTGAVLAAGALVAKDVPPYAIVGGNPAKVLRYRFDEATIERLLELAWWDWPEEKIRRAWPLLLAEEFEALFDFE